MPPDVLALDIGGANLKAAHSRGMADLRPLELWKDPAGLADHLNGLLALQPPFDILAVTMTGELCDCFETKRAGVSAILDAVETVAGGVPVRVLQTDGGLVGLAAARASPLRTAASNWLGLAEYAVRFLPGRCGLLIDAGSTTTDIIPVVEGKPAPAGRTDLDRLRSQELLYTGVRRTPVCALMGLSGAAELFATTLDAYLLLGLIPEDAGDCGTADGRPATRAKAHARLARMLCADGESLSESDTLELARRVQRRQADGVREAVVAVAARLPEPPAGVVVAGSGEFLALAALREVPSLSHIAAVSVAERLGPAISNAACAYALAVLARERAGEWE
jgi:probable H4MPT-linked C1 transfer pathway protein